MKYSEKIADWLVHLGYTHCFYVGGGNIMHLVESFSHKLNCIPVIHEVAAGIAAEYFNESASKAKALALVTAGPGLTNIITAVAGAYLESRELLVIGGQVKTADLSHGKLRQRGIQEIDGVSIAKSITIDSRLLATPIDYLTFEALIHPQQPRLGPVFLEIPIDVQAQNVSFENTSSINKCHKPTISETDLSEIINIIKCSSRPLLLIGGGVNRAVVKKLKDQLARLSIPIATTWNGADRIPSDQYNYVGRPNTWGQRSANLILQQSDLVIALGTRLGMQQTGFNHAQFVPNGKVIQFDIDAAELIKGHPDVTYKIQADANHFLERLVAVGCGDHKEWLSYCKKIRNLVPLIEPINHTNPNFISPYDFVEQLSLLCKDDDIVIPCSSGGAFTVMMQTFEQKSEQIMVTNKGLASMGYGLSGAIGASFANQNKRTLLIEGDGGFAQNIQEIGTVAINRLNIKIFIFDDSGYASIRATQRNYFGGRYVGCDTSTGLGLPNWEKLFAAWDIESIRINHGFENDPQFHALFDSDKPAAFIVSIDPEQTYFPKITSKVTENGAMESNPLHRMTPELAPEILDQVTKYLN